MQAQPEPPSRNAMLSPGKRRVTPPRNIALQAAWFAAAKWADMVVGEIRGRGAQPGAAVAAVKGRRNAELEAFRPDRVVIVFAVEPYNVVPHRKPGGFSLELPAGLDRAVHQAAEHRDLVAELLDRVVELLDGLLRGVHRDDRRGGHAVGEGPEIFRGGNVVGAASGAARLAIADARHPQ